MGLTKFLIDKEHESLLLKLKSWQKPEHDREQAVVESTAELLDFLDLLGYADVTKEFEKV